MRPSRGTRRSNPVWVSWTRVRSPSGVNVTSTSIACAGSWPGCQVNATRRGGSHVLTVPHTHSRPPGARSTMRPPSRPSNVTVSASPSNTECDASGHQLAILAVNRRNARSASAWTTTCFTTGGKLVLMAVLLCSGPTPRAISARGPRDAISRSLFEAPRIRLQDLAPHLVHVVTERGEPGDLGAIEHPSPVAPAAHEPGAAQHGEVLRDGRLAHAQVGRQLTHGMRALAEAGVEPPARGVRERDHAR